MPSQLHEALLQLFRNRPELAPELLRDALHMELPRYSQARVDAADLNEIQPAEYRADLVVLLLDGVPVFGIVVEVQLSADERKRYVWPVYVVGLRARLECPVCLLVVASDESCARWAAKPIDIGGSSRFVPWVLGPAGVPEITDPVVAIADPELAVLSAMAHGQDDDREKAVRIALAAQLASVNLDEERSKLYCDLILNSLHEVARQALLTMNPANYEYQSDFARRYVAQGMQEGIERGMEKGIERGKLQGRADLVVRLLGVRFGAISEDIKLQIAAATLTELDAIGERLLSAKTLQEALGE